MNKSRTILLVLLALVAVPWPAVAEQLSLSVTRRALDPERPRLDRVGLLEFRGALEITSPHEDFGGLSSLEVDQHGRRLTAVTDQGRWFTAQPRYDARGRLVGLTGAEIGRLHAPNGEILARKRTQDAEALTRLPDQSFLVAFEHQHRLLRYAGGSAPLTGRSTPWPTPDGLAELPDNYGIEAMTALRDGAVLAIAETETEPDLFPAWLWQGSAWQRLGYRRHGGYRPSDAALLPDGDLLVLERRFSWLGGLAARMVRVAAGTIRPGAVLEGEELAVLQPPLLTDNWEGIAAAAGPDGEALIYLLCDDNYLILQRNLLALFALWP